MKIEMGKKYKTKSGLPVRILCVDRKVPSNSTPVIALLSFTGEEEVVIYYTLEGRQFVTDCSNDLVEVNEWDDFKINQKVMVSDNGADWLKRYFAGCSSGGCPMAFKQGATSWTAEAGSLDVRIWGYCRLPTAEELKSYEPAS